MRAGGEGGEAGDDAGLDWEDAGQSGQDGTDLREICRKNPQGSNTELRGPRARKGHNPLELAAGDSGLGRRVPNKLLGHF